ncbi:hypothetical protein [Flavobacterium sp. W22_SRS_FP1]|uniref:hypothetical protein n=1 Tax=Flavobacterium sp. W22_SRS_FP1 TaxID=3240276 RepID=UPI003F8DB380
MKLRNILIVLFICIYGQSSFAQVKKDSLRVLFVGNSFTYFYNLPQVVNAMSASSKKVHIETRTSLVGGSSISQHLNQEKGTQTVEILNNQTFDYVVINHHSLATIDDADSFFEDSKKMVELVRSKNAIPVFMMTWAYDSNPLMIKTIAATYDDMAKRLGVDVVPCGNLFTEVRKWRPDLNMFDDDDKHPSKHGTYLNGLAFFKYFTNEKTTDIPERITSVDKNGQKLWLLFLSQENAAFLQQLVDEYDFKTRLN